MAPVSSVITRRELEYEFNLKQVKANESGLYDVYFYHKLISPTADQEKKVFRCALNVDV